MTKRRKNTGEKKKFDTLIHLRDWSLPHPITGRSQSVLLVFTD